MHVLNIIVDVFVLLILLAGACWGILALLFRSPDSRR